MFDVTVGQQSTTTNFLTTLSGLEPDDYRIRVVAEGDPGDRYVFRRSFTIPESPLDCLPYLIGRGMVSKRDEVTATFSSTGSLSSNQTYDSPAFTCQLDRGKPVPCKP